MRKVSIFLLLLLLPASTLLAQDWRDRHGREYARGDNQMELTPFGGIKDSGLGYKEGVQEAMKSFTNVKTYSLPW